MPRSLFPRLLRYLLLVFTLSIVPTLASAVGPVSSAGLPGGVVATDSDSGSGEAWGRTGGRVLTFSVNTPADFTSLSWGAVSAPTAAFDGSVTIGTPEVMSFNGAQSILGGGMARWSGSAQITLASPATTTTLQTRFTMTVSTIGGGPLPLSFTPGAASPGIDVLAAGPFRAVLLFEAFYPSSLGGPNDWRPLLEVYDALNTPTGTPPGTSGPAMTGFSHGFYYQLDSTPTGMSIEDHDANITTQLGSIKADTSFLRIDTVGHFNDVKQGITDLAGQISLLPTEFPTFPDIPPIPDNIATTDDVSSAKEDISNILLILFGLAPCPPEAGPLCDTAIFVQDLATQASVNDVQNALSTVQTSLGDLQASIEAISDPAMIEVEVLEAPASGNQRRWIVRTTRDGSPVDASLSRILAIHAPRNSSATTEDVTYKSNWTAIAPGLVELLLPASQGAETTLYQIEMSHVGAQGTVEGSALISTGAR